MSGADSESYGYCTLKRAERKIENINNRNKQPQEESDMDYYTSSETGSQETVKFNGANNKQQMEQNLNEEHHDSNESGFDERRDSSSSQEQIEKDLSSVKLANENNNININNINNNNNNNDDIAVLETMQEMTMNFLKEERKEVINDTKKIELEVVETQKEEEKQVIEEIIKEEPKVEEKLKEIKELPKSNALRLQEIKEALAKHTERNENGFTRIYDSTQNIANSEQTFYEEEYSYEPELKRSSSKLVMRTRSLLNLEEESNNTSHYTFQRPTAVRNKITTGPDGTFVIAGRKANSELNLSDESNNNSSTNSPKSTRLVSGEELKKRKEEIFKTKEIEKPSVDENKVNEEITRNNEETTKEKAINNLKKYLKEKKIGLKELLTNNNVVIIEPFREETNTTDVSEYNHRNVEFDKGCRITGATVKPSSLCELPSSESNTLPRAAKPHQPHVQRHYFYHLIKTKSDLKDDELPDPDKVRNTRQMFQKVLKVNRKPNAADIMLPIAAKIVNPSKETKPRLTPEVRVVDNAEKKVKQQNNNNNNNNNNSDMKAENFPKKCMLKKWTDSGSLSSGVSSDMSCFDNDLDNNLDEISQKGYSSEDEAEPDLYNHDEEEGHPVSPEVMQKIRACGTTVTYYGGRVISHSHGPVRSPMTMTIMDEIRQGNEENTNNNRKARDQYLGVKFRLIKSNSCGSRLELAGTEADTTAPQAHYEPSKNRFYEDMYGKSLGEELAECRGRMEPIEDVEDREDLQTNIAKVQAVFEKKITPEEDTKPMQSWRALIESRKQSRAKELRRPCNDMEFEEFQVAES